MIRRRWFKCGALQLQYEFYFENSNEKVISLILVFLPPLYSPVVVSMMKDGGHDKTQMVNKCTFNNNNDNNYNDDDDHNHL